MSIRRWLVTVEGNQQKFRDFCESFMTPDIEVLEVNGRVVCSICIDPYKPIDSTGSMPSLIDQLGYEGGFTNITVEKPSGFTG